MSRFRFTLISVAFRMSFVVALAIGGGAMTVIPNLAHAEPGVPDAAQRGLAPLTVAQDASNAAAPWAAAPAPQPLAKPVVLRPLTPIRARRHSHNCYDY